MIISKTPFRISLFGGGTDYPEWFQDNGGAVLATTIDKYCYISCRHLPQFFEHKHRIVYSKVESVQEIEQIQHPAVRAVFTSMGIEEGMEIHHDGDLPARSGLGSSSSFTVGLINALTALNGRQISKEELAQQALYIEQEVIKENVGSQDQVLAAYGGFNKIEFGYDKHFDLSAVIMDHEREEQFQKHLMLFFTGLSRYSSDIAGKKIANLKNRKPELSRMREMVGESLSILQDKRSDLNEIGRLLGESWQLKRRLSDKVSTPKVDQIYKSGLEGGATGGKILGAGGGGFILFFAEPQYHDKIKERLKNLIHVSFRFSRSGSKIVIYEPNGLK